MSKDGSAAAETAGRLVPDKFPMGLRVLLVDDDPTCLEILRTKLQHLCKYNGMHTCLHYVCPPGNVI